MSTTIDSPFGEIDLDALAPRPQGDVVGIAMLNPALRATLRTEYSQKWPAGSPIIIIAWVDNGAMIVGPDGRVTKVHLEEIQMDWSYSAERDRWVDAAGEPIDEVPA